MLGYHIQYNSDTVTKIRIPDITKHSIPVKWWVMTACCMIVFVLISTSATFRSWLIPGDDAVTRQAFDNFTEDVRAGGSVGSAFEAFCIEIIESVEVHDCES